MPAAERTPSPDPLDMTECANLAPATMTADEFDRLVRLEDVTTNQGSLSSRREGTQPPQSPSPLNVQEP